MSANELDPSILSTLTPEERELVQGDMTDIEKEALAAIAAGEDEPEPAATQAEPAKVKTEEPDPAAATKAAESEASTTAAASTETKTQAKEGQPEPAAAPRDTRIYEAKLPDDFDAKVQALGEQESELAQRFKEGDIDFDEFRVEQAKINDQRLELNSIKMKADISREMNEQSAEREWKRSVDAMMEQAIRTDGIDYLKDDAKRKDLDLFVKSLAADEANDDKPAEWFLEEAHRMVKIKNGMAVSASTTTTTTNAGEGSRKQELAPPKTVAHVPGSDGPGDVKDEFADIDALEGLDFEKALAKMSPDQRARYLAAA